MQDEELFKKKNLDKLRSPEELNDYIHVINPTVWLLLAAVIILIASAFFWGIFGTIERKIPTQVCVDDGVAYCYVPASQKQPVEAGMTVKYNNLESKIVEIETNNVEGYLCYLSVSKDQPEGIYDGKIVTKVVSPISLIFD